MRQIVPTFCHTEHEKVRRTERHRAHVVPLHGPGLQVVQSTAGTKVALRKETGLSGRFWKLRKGHTEMGTGTESDLTKAGIPALDAVDAAKRLMVQTTASMRYCAVEAARCGDKPSFEEYLQCIDDMRDFCARH